MSQEEKETERSKNQKIIYEPRRKVDKKIFLNQKCTMIIIVIALTIKD